jgi:hypothetical protein
VNDEHVREARIELEQDGTCFRWVMVLGERRLAKAHHWFNTEDEAQEAADEFLEAIGTMGDA